MQTGIGKNFWTAKKMRTLGIYIPNKAIHRENHGFEKCQAADISKPCHQRA